MAPRLARDQIDGFYSPSQYLVWAEVDDYFVLRERNVFPDFVFFLREPTGLYNHVVTTKDFTLGRALLKIQSGVTDPCPST